MASERALQIAASLWCDKESVRQVDRLIQTVVA
jgi:hypothetical protein